MTSGKYEVCFCFVYKMEGFKMYSFRIASQNYCDSNVGDWFMTIYVVYLG